MPVCLRKYLQIYMGVCLIRWMKKRIVVITTTVRFLLYEYGLQVRTLDMEKLLYI